MERCPHAPSLLANVPVAKGMQFSIIEGPSGTRKDSSEQKCPISTAEFVLRHWILDTLPFGLNRKLCRKPISVGVMASESAALGDGERLDSRLVYDKVCD
jgi:hypothetical protein